MNKLKKRIYDTNWMRQWRMKNPELQLKIGRMHHKNRKARMGTAYYKHVAKVAAKWRKNNPEKVMVYRKVFVAQRNGTLKKKSCFCGDPKSEAHHRDYSKPLKIKWLCKKHHRLADLKRKRRELSTALELII